jgi:hypothetical protein
MFLRERWSKFLMGGAMIDLGRIQKPILKRIKLSIGLVMWLAEFLIDETMIDLGKIQKPPLLLCL